MQINKKVILVSRCAWTLYNYRTGLMRELKKAGCTVIAGGMGGDGFEAKIEELGVRFVSLPADKRRMNPWADMKLFWSLYQMYRREQPDVVHHFTIKPVIYGSLAGRLAGVPKVINTITGLGFIFIEEKMVWLRRFVEWQYWLALSMAHFTFFQNADDLQHFVSRRLVGARKTGLLPGSGVDCTRFTPVLAEHKPTGRQLSFLLVARLLREKGIYEFVDAARLVKAAFPNLAFYLLGQRDERNPTVVPQADLDYWKAEGILTWLGEVLDVRPVVALADVVVLPSYREGVPRSLLEAAAMGKPIITTNAVGCREVVDDEVNGFLVPVKDVKALARAMIRMIQHPEMRMRMGRASREKVECAFEETVVIEKIVNAYV